jgi:hypothetical protein
MLGTEMLFLLFVVLVVIVAVVYRDVIMDAIAAIIWLKARDARARARLGGDDHQPYFYHGTDQVVDVFEPRPSLVIDGEKAVFATSSYDDAVVFSAIWTDYDFGFGSINGVRFLVENYPGALEKLNRNGYIHSLPSKYFTHDPRLGLSNEYISRTPVATVKYDIVNIARHVAASSIRVIKYNENLPTVDTVEPDLQRRVDSLYILTDPYWQVPQHIVDGLEHGGAKVIFFYNEDGDDKLNGDIRALGEDVKCILIGDPVDLYAGVIKLGFVRKPHLLEPETLIGPTSRKTTAAEYARFIAARRKMFEGVPRVVV